MTRPPIDAVIAGTRPFALALFAPLSARLGTRPRVAADPLQAPALCGPGGILVLEYGDGATVESFAHLARAHPALRIVAGVPVAHASAEEALRASGIAPARWDGRPDAVLLTVERVAGAAGAPTTAAVVAGGGPGAPAAVEPAAAPRAGPPPPSRVGAARPAVGPAPVPPPVPPTAARPAAPGPTTARSEVPRAAAPAAPALAASPVTPAAVPPPPSRAAPAAAPPPPPSRVAPAVAAAPSTSIAAAAASTNEGTPGPRAGPPPEGPVAPVDFRAPGLYVPPPPATAAPRMDWPSAAPSPAEAEEALVAALRCAPGEEVPAAAEAVLDRLTVLERGALGEAAVDVDRETIRRVAAIRLRVAAAIASAPPPGSPVDQGGVQAILGEIDDLLARVGALAPGAPPELQHALEDIRHGLVREAIDFSEAAQRSAGAADAAPVPTQRPPARGAQARVIRISAEEEVASRRPRAAWITLAIVLAAAAAFHGHHYVAREKLVASFQTLPGAPEGMMLVPAPAGATRMLVPIRGAAPDRAEVERFVATQQAAGNTVRELPGGVLEITAARQDGASRSMR